jgi:hypothetical protein
VVLSTGTGVNPGITDGPASAAVAAVPSLYTVTNVIEWGVTNFGLSRPPAGGADVIDTFGLTAQVAAVPIPEPASLVVMLMGVPLPLVFLLRRRRALA